MRPKKRVRPVLIFTAPGCPHCSAAKRYFRQKGIRFKDIDVSRDHAAARDMIKISGQSGVPVIKIGSKVVIGFNRPKIDHLLQLS